MAQTANIVQLKPRTLEAFEAYIREAEAAMEPALHGDPPVPVVRHRSDLAQQVRQGEIVAEFWTGRSRVEVPNGLIHDWIGGSLHSAHSVRKRLALVQDYDNHKNVYKPDVMDSKLISQDGNDFQIFLRLLKKKIITVVLDTDHDVHYLSRGRRTVVLPLLHHANCRGRRSRDRRKKRSCRPTPAMVFCGACTPTGVFRNGRRRVRRVPGHFTDARHSARAGMDHRTDHPQAAARVADQHPESHARRTHRGVAACKNCLSGGVANAPGCRQRPSTLLYSVWGIQSPVRILIFESASTR